ncbi:enoyl-CoA hydratase/isomerase family protein [Flavobacterium sp.]|uniref:enoyl-CoA hydratase/isomerase family protein n=1 Tax=Flavobacterium sp. TaxID=239 RepID=UPI003528D48A
MEGSVTYKIKEKVAHISFYNPASNSFPSSQLQLLTETINKLSQNNAVTVIVLQSEGNGAFCAGASFNELLNISTLEEGEMFFSGFANVINAMRKSSKLIIGRVHGKAVGGGVGLISACDYTFATENAAVKLSELAIGIGPFVIEPAVSKKIGKTAMAEMTLGATEWKSARWALDKGLFSKLFSSVEEMDNAIKVFTTEIATYNPDALLEMKKIIWENTEHWDTLLYERAAISGKLVLSEFTKNALAQFRKS